MEYRGQPGDERRAIIQQQGWNDATLKQLMEYFIESHELGEQFDAFLVSTARIENESAGGQNAKLVQQ